MSIWTHVVGNIRVDGIPNVNCSVDDIKAKLGKICTFEHWEDDVNLPCGSEGSLQYDVIEYDYGMPWITIPIWGDLRDFNDTEMIKSWWRNTLKDIGIIRDAVLLLYIDRNIPVVLTHNNI